MSRTPSPRSISNTAITEIKQNDDNTNHLATVNVSSNIIDIKNIQNNIIANDQCIFWYFGAKCLTKDCVKFYRPILNHIYHQNAEAYLLDLKASGALQDGNADLINQKNRFISNIEQISDNKIHTISVADIYQILSEISKESNASLFEFIETVLDREELHVPSQQHKSHCVNKQKHKDTTLFGDVFTATKFPVLSKLADLTPSECYSIMQYIEIFIIIHFIAKKKSENNGEISLKFISPNDEYKYYVNANSFKISQQKFEMDINKFLLLQEGQNMKQKINISINCFRFGDNVAVDRPYIKGRGFKKNKKCLSAEQLFGEQSLGNNTTSKPGEPSKRKMKRDKKKQQKKQKRLKYKQYQSKMQSAVTIKPANEPRFTGTFDLDYVVTNPYLMMKPIPHKPHPLI